MNRSLRAAGGVLATAAIVTSVLVAVALVDPRATAMPTGHDDAGALSADGVAPRDPRSPAPWHRLGEQLDDLEKRLDEQARCRKDDLDSARRELVEAEGRLWAELDRGLGDERLLETIKTALARRGDQQRFASIETRLKRLTGTIERELQETATLREAIGRLQPVLDVSADSLRPGRFTIAVRRVPLADVLDRLEALSDWKFETTAAATALVSIDRLEGVTLEQALEVLLPAAGCAARLDGRQVSVMSLAEARRRQERVEASPSPGTTRPLPRSQPADTVVAPAREVILDLVIVSIELTDEYPGGIGDLVERIDAPGHAASGILDQSVSEFLERLDQMVSMRILARPRLRVVDGEVARLETARCLTTVVPGLLPGSPTGSDLSTRLLMRPRIVADGRIELEITPSRTTAASAADKRPPSPPTRVLLVPGRTVLFDGLFPVVTRGPSVAEEPAARRPRLLEQLFGGRDQKSAVVSTRLELIVLVTPRLVDQRSGEPLRPAAR